MSGLDWREPLWLLLMLYPLLQGIWHVLQQRRQADAYADRDLLPWAQANQRGTLMARFGWTLPGLFWILMALALAGPRTPQVPDTPPDAVLDVMVVLDMSRSMQVDDVSPNRLQRAVLELHEWLPLRAGSRVGVVVYAARPHSYVPLTADEDALRFYLPQLDSLTLPTQGSGHADALAFAQKTLAERPDPQLPAAILWMTDGDIPDTAREPLAQTVQALTEDNLPLYILGLGTVDGDAIPLGDGQWLQQQGQPVRSAMNTALLQQLAASGQGRFSHVQANARDWQILYTDGMQQQAANTDTENAQAWREWYVLPLAAAWLLLLWLWRKPAAQRALTSGIVALLVVMLSTQPTTAMAEERAETAVTDGISAYREGNYEHAIRAFSSAIFTAENDTQRARALYNLGNSYYQQGDYLAAQQVFADVLHYQPQHMSALHNLRLTETVLTEIERQLAAKGVADGQEEGWTFERLSNALDWDTETTPGMEMDEGISRPQSPASLPIPPDPDRLQTLAAKGLAHLQQSGAINPQSWQQRQQSKDSARIALKNTSDNPAALWKRLFEIEEGFPAALDTPRTLPDVAPW